MPTMILGTHLSEALQRDCKAAFIYRYTGENRPAWATKPMRDGSRFPLHFADDADWLAHTYFPITKRGKLARRPAHSESSPTWPNNPEFRKGRADV